MSINFKKLIHDTPEYDKQYEDLRKEVQHTQRKHHNGPNATGKLDAGVTLTRIGLLLWKTTTKQGLSTEYLASPPSPTDREMEYICNESVELW